VSNSTATSVRKSMREVKIEGTGKKQQGAEVGYNPHKRGATSYNPQLAFCAATKEGKLICGGRQMTLKIPADLMHPKPWEGWLRVGMT